MITAITSHQPPVLCMPMEHGAAIFSLVLEDLMYLSQAPLDIQTICGECHTLQEVSTAVAISERCRSRESADILS